MVAYFLPFAKSSVDEGSRDGSGSFNVAAVSENGAC